MSSREVSRTVDSGERSRRREVLELFRAARQPFTARQIADELGMHLNTARFHLDTLVRQGLLRRDEAQAAGPGRPPARYSLTPGMDRDGPRNWRLLAEIALSHLATHDDAAAAAEAAGVAWGRYLVQPIAPGQTIGVADATLRLVDLFADIGFAPHLVADGERPRVELHHCPFLELAETHRTVVCAVHLGLMRGALHELGTALHADALVPFDDPETCVAQLSTTMSEAC